MTDAVDTGSTGTPGWWLDRLSRRLTERVRSQHIYEDYYHGDHRLSYATRKLLEAFGETFRYLRVNYCGVVVDALAERLEVQGFRFGDDQSTADAAWAIWQRNVMDARFAHGLREGLIKGESSGSRLPERHASLAPLASVVNRRSSWGCPAFRRPAPGSCLEGSARR